MKFELNNNINSKVSFCQGDFTKINVDAIVNAVNKTLVGELFMELFMKLQSQDCYLNVRN